MSTQALRLAVMNAIEGPALIMASLDSGKIFTLGECSVALVANRTARLKPVHHHLYRWM